MAFFFKQSAGVRTEMGIELDGVRHEEYPLPHPSDSRNAKHRGQAALWVHED